VGKRLLKSGKFPALPVQILKRDEIKPACMERCSECGSTEVHTDQAHGELVCEACGVHFQKLVEKLRDESPSPQGTAAETTAGIEAKDFHTILVVDDSDWNLMLFGDIFEEEGYEVYRASNGQEGIDLALSKLPDVILMDLAMPGMDGFEARAILKNNPKTVNIPVIACTAFAIPEFKDRAEQEGFATFITKPIEPRHLVERIRKAVLKQ